MKQEEYENKRLERVNRFNELSEKAEVQSRQARQVSDKISSFIPFGQPILCGHHSEGKHRRDLKRIQNNMDKSIELSKKAEYYKNKAETILNNNSIRQDDPEAIQKLKEKINKLEKNNEKIKDLNAKLRKFKTLSNAEKEVSKLPDENPDKPYFIKMLSHKNFYAMPPERINAYYLDTVSNTAEIKRLQDRIKQLENKQSIGEVEKQINGITLKVDQNLNRVMLFFPDIPSVDTRSKLKHSGFKWSPNNKAWQNYINNRNMLRAEEIIKEVA